MCLLGFLSMQVTIPNFILNRMLVNYHFSFIAYDHEEWSNGQGQIDRLVFWNRSSTLGFFHRSMTAILINFNKNAFKALLNKTK